MSTELDIIKNNEPQKESQKKKNPIDESLDIWRYPAISWELIYHQKLVFMSDMDVFCWYLTMAEDLCHKLSI